MIETTVLTYLKRKLSVPVFMEKQKSSGEYVVIEKTGSSSDNYIFSAILAIKSYGSTMYKAAELNELVKNVMEHIVDTEDISKCRINTDYNYTDTTTKEYRYQAIFELTY